MFGARPIKRVLQREVADGLAREILEGKIASGDRVVIDVEGDAFAFSVAAGGAENEEADSATMVQSNVH